MAIFGKSKSLEERYPSLYTFDALKNFISSYIEGYTSQEVIEKGRTEEEVRQIKDKKKDLMQNLENCTYRDRGAKDFIKLYIKQLITNKHRSDEVLVEEYPIEYAVNADNIDIFIDFDIKSHVSPDYYLMWKIIIREYIKEYDDLALVKLIEKYDLCTLRKDEFQEEMFFITKEDVLNIYLEEKIDDLSFEDKLEILVQMIFEKYKGFGVIDDILYMDEIDEVSIGVTGLPNENINLRKNKSKNINFAYDSICVRYRGMPIHFKHLSFGSWAELKRVNELIVSYEQKSDFSRSNPILLGYMKNGSRVTATRYPFTECHSGWIRNFPIKDASFERLVKGIKRSDNPILGWEKVVKRMMYLMRAGINTCIGGGQGLGKTTALISIIKYIYAFYSIRLIESEFESRVRNRYPNRDISAFQETGGIDAAKAYNHSLRTSGDVIAFCEARGDRLISELSKAFNRGSKFSIFTFHPNDPSITPLEIANAMLRMGIYGSLKEALKAVLSSLESAVQIEKNDITGDRYYNIYEYVANDIEIPKTFIEKKGMDRIDAFMETCYFFFEKMTQEKSYSTNPIVEFDYELNGYVVKKQISDKLYKKMIKNIYMPEERLEIKKLFRPEMYIRDTLKANGLKITRDNILNIIISHEIDNYRDNDLKAIELEERLGDV